MNKVKAITDKIIYATLATVDENGQPWNSPVWSIHDEDYTYYWYSWRENQHSKNIRANSKVFIVVYDSTVPEGSGEGVYIQAKAEEVNREEEVKKLILKRNEIKADAKSIDDFVGDSPRRWYKAMPEKIWLNDVDKVDGIYVDVRKQVL